MWSISVKIDADKTDVGTISATWTDPTYGPVSYSERIQATQAGADAFIAKVIVMRDAWQARMADDAAKANYVLGRLNTADPQIGG